MDLAQATVAQRRAVLPGLHPGYDGFACDSRFATSFSSTLTAFW
jgi:hypothetical protein